MKRIECTIDGCGKCYKSRFTYRRHLEADHYGIKRYTCLLCNKSFVYKHSLKEHTEKHGSEDVQGERNERSEIHVPKLTGMLEVAQIPPAKPEEKDS